MKLFFLSLLYSNHRIFSSKEEKERKRGKKAVMNIFKPDVINKNQLKPAKDNEAGLEQSNGSQVQH